MNRETAVQPALWTCSPSRAWLEIKRQSKPPRDPARPRPFHFSSRLSCSLTGSGPARLLAAHHRAGPAAGLLSFSLSRYPLCHFPFSLGRLYRRASHHPPAHSNSSPHLSSRKSVPIIRSSRPPVLPPAAADHLLVPVPTRPISSGTFPLYGSLLLLAREYPSE